MCECGYLHSCVSVVTNLRGYTIVCFAASLRASRSEETPPRPLTPTISHCESYSVPLRLPFNLRSPVAPPFALFTHDTLNQEEINADDAFTVSLSLSFCGWISR